MVAADTFRRDHAPSWYAATANDAPSHSRLDGAITADVCIIGGGFTGLSAALHLAERGYKTVLLEGNRIGWGASGRNGGQIHSGQRRDQDYLETIAGKEAARQLWDFGEEAKALIRERIARHKIDCDLRDGLIHGDHKPAYVDHSRAEAEKLQRDYGYDQIRFLDRDAIRAAVETEDFHGGTLDMGAGHLHPLNFALGLARAATEAGAILHEQSRVTAINHGSTVAISTDGGTVTARFVIIAANGYLGDLDTRVAARVMPLNNFIIATQPLGERAKALIPGNQAVADSRFVINYFRLSPDGRLLFGGGESCAIDLPGDIGAVVRPKMLRLFPQLADVAIDYAWGGTLAITPKRLPYMRRLAPNVFNASGFCGQGVTIAPLAGKLLAEAVDGTMGRFDVFAKLPVPPFPGGPLMRYPTLVMAMTWFALRDRLPF